MNDYKLLLDFFGQVDDTLLHKPLFQLDKYFVDKYFVDKVSDNGYETWYVDNVNLANRIPFESQGEALLWAVKKWAKDQDWELIKVGEYRHKGNYIISYNDKSGDWDFYNGTTHLNSWSDPISAFDLANLVLRYKSRRKSINKRIKKVKQTIRSGKLYINDSSIKDALITVANIETNFNQRSGGLIKIEIVTLNKLYTAFGGKNES
jgi:hypothetical protein